MKYNYTGYCYYYCISTNVLSFLLALWQSEFPVFLLLRIYKYKTLTEFAKQFDAADRICKTV